MGLLYGAIWAFYMVLYGSALWCYIWAMAYYMVLYGSTIWCYRGLLNGSTIWCYLGLDVYYGGNQKTNYDIIWEFFPNGKP